MACVPFSRSQDGNPTDANPDLHRQLWCSLNGLQPCGSQIQQAHRNSPSLLARNDRGQDHHSTTPPLRREPGRCIYQAVAGTCFSYGCAATCELKTFNRTQRQGVFPHRLRGRQTRVSRNRRSTRVNTHFLKETTSMTPSTTNTWLIGSKKATSPSRASNGT